jgi:putative Holliday junction resolvase
MRRRALALDLGKTRIGAAVSDPLGWTAQPLETIQVRSIRDTLARVRDWIEQYQVGTVVVGMPYNMDGTEGEQAQWARHVGERLAGKFPDVKIVYWDERLTTSASESVLLESGMTRKKRKTHRDQLAAMLILQSYLEFQRQPRSAEKEGQ